MKRVIKLDEGKRVSLPATGEVKSYSRILITRETTGAKNYSLLVSEQAPSFCSSDHVHDVEEHGFFILSGHGVISIGEEDYDLGPNTAVYIPPGVKHKIKNTGTKSLKYVVIYAPPGPESKMKREK